MTEQSQECAYFICIPFDKESPECTKVTVGKVTAKLVILATCEYASGYQTRWKKDKIHWSPLEAWLNYQESQKRHVFDVGVDLDNANSHLNAANDAIEALLHAERNSPDG